ncbi:MAG: SIS domain-containing protein [Acidobacteria bacterium]|nr:SIS domain-containing protein [Acidobacteriota bacterium]
MGFREHILAQPMRLRSLIAGLRRANHPLRAPLPERRKLLLTGMGSSLFACYPAYLRLAREGTLVTLWETAELLHFALEAIDPETMVVAVSQSGETAEIRALLERLPPSQPVVGVTNHPESALGRRADVTLELGADRAPYASAQTFVNSVALLLALARRQALDSFLAAAEGAADALARALGDWFNGAEVTLEPGGHVVFLSRGPGLAAARQAALMFHEVAARGAAAMSAAAFRHGPLEMAGPGLQAVVLMPPGPTGSLVENLAVELERHRSRVIRVPAPPVDVDLALIVQIAAPQALACREALRVGREPGVFLQAESVTRTE